MLKFSSESTFGIISQDSTADSIMLQKFYDNWEDINNAHLTEHYGVFNSLYTGENSVQPHATLFRYLSIFYALNAKACNKQTTPYISYCIQSINARPNEPGFMSSFNPKSITPNPGWTDTTHNYNVSIIVVKRGMNYFNACAAWAAEYQIASIPEDILKLMTNPEFADHKMNGYLFANKAIIVTNHWDQAWANKLYALAPSIYPELKYLIEKDNICRNIFAALYQNDAELLRPVLTWFLDYWDKAKNDIAYTRIIERLTCYATAGLSNAQQAQENAKSQLDSALRSYNQYLATFVEAEQNLLRYQLEDIKPDLSLIDYLKRANNIKVSAQQSTDYLKFEITAPITNFRNEDLTSWYRRPSENSITSSPITAAILYDALINHKYQLITKTKVSMPYQATQHSWVMARIGNCIGNPHLIHYNCWPNAKRLANTAIQKGDFISAINYVISACTTITFTDSAVVRAFMSDLSVYENEPCWQDTEGNMFSTKQLQHKYEQFADKSGPDIAKALKKEAAHETD